MAKMVRYDGRRVRDVGKDGGDRWRIGATYTRSGSDRHIISNKGDDNPELLLIRSACAAVCCAAVSAFFHRHLFSMFEIALDITSPYIISRSYTTEPTKQSTNHPMHHSQSSLDHLLIRDHFLLISVSPCSIP